MRLKQKAKHFLEIIISLFMLTKSWNIFVLALAQYFSAFFIFSHTDNYFDVLLDKNLFMIVITSSLIVSAGYLINSFYNSEKDKINRPIQTKWTKKLSNSVILKGYVFLNFVASLLALMVSLKAFIFFTIFILATWLYSHKFQKMVGVANVLMGGLSIIPLFAIFLYYKNFDGIVIIYGLFLFTLILIKEVLKDFSSFLADEITDYKTLPIFLGKKKTTQILQVLFIICLVFALVLFNLNEATLFRYYFVLVCPLFLFSIFYLNNIKSAKSFYRLLIFFRIAIITGVFSLVLYPFH